MKIALTILTTAVLFLGTIASGQPAQQMARPTPGGGGGGRPMFGGGGFGMPMDPMGMMAMMMGGGFGGGAMSQRPGVGRSPQQRWNYGWPSAQAQVPPLQAQLAAVEAQAEQEAAQMFAPMLQKADQELNQLLLQDPLDLEKIQRKVRQLDVLRVQQRLARQEAELKVKQDAGLAPPPQ